MLAFFECGFFHTAIDKKLEFLCLPERNDIYFFREMCGHMIPNIFVLIREGEQQKGDQNAILPGDSFFVKLVLVNF